MIQVLQSRFKILNIAVLLTVPRPCLPLRGMYHQNRSYRLQSRLQISPDVEFLIDK